MYSSVLLIGGGFMFNGAANMLQSRLQAKLPAPHRKLVDQVEVIARPKVRYVLFFFCSCLKQFTIVKAVEVNHNANVYCRSRDELKWVEMR